MTLPLAAQINRAASARNIPQSALIELTYDCNLDCYYCYIRKAPKRRVLTSREWKRVLKELSGAGCLYLTLSGGEAFLRKDLPDIIGHARKLSFAVSLITNGTLISKSMAKAIAGFGVLDVGLSFHAATPSLHDALSGERGSFAKTLAALRCLKSSGTKVAIKHTVSKRNFNEFRGLSRLAKREEALFECDSVVVPHGRNRISPYALAIEEHQAFLKFMKMKPAPLSCAGNPEGNLHCDAGRSVMGISPFGDVYPCIQLPVKLGNVRNRSIAEIWHGKAALNFRNAEEVIAKECLICGIRDFCGRCPGLSLAESGNWKGKAEVLCIRAQAIARMSR